ncbi:MAG: DUF72 domain-containing protein [Verrucomicrobia bacterium]|nr:DUF72 domain-containing protein [Verrucomicrobiota bacterium]
MSEPGFQLKSARESLQGLSRHGVFVGTSSWKYEGWVGTLYSASKYEYRGRFAQTRFERSCLEEYAAVFKTVCVDAAYYDFPRASYLEGLASQVPADFQFALKVTDAITVKKFPNLDRFGARAGQLNPEFLNPRLFADHFLAPCDTIRSQIGLLILEFSRFWPSDYSQGRAFVTDLDRFLEQVPKGWPLGIELRNEGWLQPEYFERLARHEVTHVFNSWEVMPSVSEQMALPESRTCPSRLAARFLLKPGRKYADAVKAFQPYDQVREINPEVRAAGRALIREGQTDPARKTFIFVNNRLEGNALGTIAAMIA